MARKKRTRNRTSPAMDIALEYIHSTGGKATPQDVVTKCGASRATAYNAVKKYKEEGFVPNSGGEAGDGESSSRKTGVVRGTAKRKSTRATKTNISATTSNSEIPSSLRRKPGFNLEGFHLESNKELKVEGKLLWADIVYKGVCPVCTKEVDLYKTAIQFSDSGKKEIHQRWSGTCRHCSISISLDKSRK